MGSKNIPFTILDFLLRSIVYLSLNYQVTPDNLSLILRACLVLKLHDIFRHLSVSPVGREIFGGDVKDLDVAFLHRIDDTIKHFHILFCMECSPVDLKDEVIDGELAWRSDDIIKMPQLNQQVVCPAAFTSLSHDIAQVPT